ncbi:phosphatase PAP2 family protein [Legionella cardiaca]|uniref:Phosphatase PAP2 family protein n=1 Tax=Legionella cardiaca TaxID=1071983 RepID=A0ABY8AUP2_9GAMM|nr:phosphatase PAP2 family protein [Legionella cardiaca]WED44417.1 phosphatase PAP2 family protein [Legionella cardiaca]
MQRNTQTCSLFAALVLCLLALIALYINTSVFKYPGNNYFPPDVFLIAVLLFLALIGSYLQFGRGSIAVKITKELIYYFLVMSVIALATNAIQYTPFAPIDNQLIELENSLHINVNSIVAWTVSHSWLTTLLVHIYDSLPYQMSILPVVTIFMRKFFYMREYYCLLLISALIGFALYYFYPTVAPASVINSPLFTPEQYATGIKFKEIHQHLPPSTMEGGMIAFPSFHAIWAWLCLYLVRWSRLLFYLFLPINLLLIASCVLLGWHYPLDLVGSGLVLLLTYSLCSHCAKKELTYFFRNSTRVS